SPLGQQSVGVDTEIGQIVAERAQPDLAVGVNVTLPDFEKATERLEQSEILADGLAGERIEHNIEAFSFRNAHHLVGEIARARVEDMIDANETQILRFWRCARSAESATAANRAD